MPRQVAATEHASEALVPPNVLKVVGVDTTTAAAAPPGLVVWENVTNPGPNLVKVGVLRYATPPGHLRRVAFLNLAAVLDSFTRADSATLLGTGETGQSYIASVGTWGISSNRAYSASDADGNVATMDALLNDGTFAVTLNGDLTATNYRSPAFLFRYLDVSNFLMVRLLGGACDLFKRDLAAYTVLATAATTTADATDYRIEVVCLGTSVKVYLDGVLKITHTLAGGDATKYVGASYTRVGFMLFKAGVPTVAARWDDLRVSR